MVNIKKDLKDKRKKLVHLAFSENELNEIDKIRKQLKTTRTEFIRQAINDKIMRIENPEAFKEIVTIDVDNKQLKEILEMTSESSEKIDILLEKFDTINKIKNTLSTLNLMINRPALQEKELVIIELLKKHKELKPNKIMELTGFTIEEIYDIISNGEIFKTTINGGFRLNE